MPNETAHPYWLADTPLALVFNGPFSVSIFFILSGFVVAQAASRSASPAYVNIMLRYLRLALPSTASVIFAWFLLTLFPTASTQLNAVVNHYWAGETYQGDIPTIGFALCDGMVKIFVDGSSGFNGVLWTMKIEAEGSILLYAIYGLTQGKIRVALLVLLAIPCLLSPRYLGFILGALMRERWSRGQLGAFSPTATLVAGVVLGFPATGFAARIGIPHLPHALTLGAADGWIPPIAAAMIVYSTLTSGFLQYLMSTKFVQYLGRISFSLYLVHYVLIYTAIASLYVFLQPVGNFALVSIFLIYLILSLALASLAEKWVDQPILEGIRKFRAMLRDRMSAAVTPVAVQMTRAK